MRTTRQRIVYRRRVARVAAAIPLLLLAACTPAVRTGTEEPAGEVAGIPAEPLDCPAVPDGEPPEPPVALCDDALLTGYDGLLVLAPHPDDEILGFAGLTAAYMAQGKPVEVIVATDGDAYCGACRFWKNASVTGDTCSAADLAEFARVRRTESAAAAAVLGRPAPEFLGYPDTGLAAAWRENGLGRPETPLHRSDFSACADCETCTAGYGEGPDSGLTAASLLATLEERIAAASERTLLATTHPLDGHGDHSGLGNFIKTINDGLEHPRPVVYAIIHAHTPKETPAPDCWYPGPEAVACACPDERCAEADPGWIAGLRDYRFRPEWPDAFPDDAPYGEPRHLCLPEALYRGEADRGALDGDPPGRGEPSIKLSAVEKFRSQLGTLAREGEVPAHLRGIVDCNGYLTSFVRSTEAFALSDPATAPVAGGPAGDEVCDAAGKWVGGSATIGTDGVVAERRAQLTLANPIGGYRYLGRLSWPLPGGAEGSAPVAAERAPGGCGVQLTIGNEVWLGRISRDGASLYLQRNEPGPGFHALHRSVSTASGPDSEATEARFGGAPPPR